MLEKWLFDDISYVQWYGFDLSAGKGPQIWSSICVAKGIAARTRAAQPRQPIFDPFLYPLPHNRVGLIYFPVDRNFRILHSNSFISSMHDSFGGMV